MKTLFTLDFTQKTITASKTTLNKASKLGTPEYKELMKILAKHPTFEVVEKVINIKANKNVHKGLTYDVMEAHLESIKDEAKKDEYMRVKKQGKYPLVKSWFMTEFPNFKIADGKKTATKVKIAKVAA